MTIQRELGTDSLLRILSEPNVKTSNDIIYFAERGDSNGVKRMIEERIDVIKTRGMDGFTPLHHACNRGHVQITSMLLVAGMDVDCTNNTGETPLHLATYMGHLLIVEQLLDCGANINARNCYGETALFYASRKGYPALVRLLLQRGANASIIDSNDEVALDHAFDRRTAESFDIAGRSASSGSAVQRISHSALQRIYSFLTTKEIGRSACVCGKWHRASESEEVWAASKLRRWEYALQASLGFDIAPMAQFRPIKKKSSRNILDKKTPSSISMS